MDIDLLVVDDEGGIREMLTRLAETAGATCCAVATGEAGLELLRGGARFRVLLADYCLEGMDGIEFLEAARELTPGATRVLFTGIDQARVAQEATLRARVSYFLVKPVGLAELRQVLSDVLHPADVTDRAPAEGAVQAYRKQHRQKELEEMLGRVPGRRGSR